MLSRTVVTKTHPINLAWFSKANSDIVVSLFSSFDFQAFIIPFLNTLIVRTGAVLDFSDHLL